MEYSQNFEPPPPPNNISDDTWRPTHTTPLYTVSFNSVVADKTRTQKKESRVNLPGWLKISLSFGSMVKTTK